MAENKSINNSKSQILDAALEVFNKDCLIRLGTSVNPIFKKTVKDINLFSYYFKYNEKEYKGTIKSKQVVLFSIPYESVDIILEPDNNIDLGNGFGEKIETQIFGGEVGILFDGRLKDSSGNIIIKNKEMILQWYKNIKVYNL